MILQQLSEAYGPSGDEGPVRELIAEEVRPHVEVLKVDSMGNLIAAKGLASSRPPVMVCAHMDEVALMVSWIEENGLLRFKKVGGIDDRILLSRAVKVGRKGVHGVIGAKPIHLQRPAERKSVVQSTDMFIDIGATDRSEAEKVVEPGDYALFDTRFEVTGDGMLKGKALDDRVGCAILCEVLKGDYSFPLYAVFTVQEELGLRGATVAAYSISPALGLVLEGTTCADIPGTEEPRWATRLGGGPALSVMDRASIANKDMLRRLREVAEREKIPYQFRRTTASGNDAGPVSLTREGVPTATVSVPCRYIHSAASMASRSDFENTVNLVSAFLADLSQRGY